MAQQVGAYGYSLQFTVVGFATIAEKSFRVLITRPDLTTFERLSTDDDVEVVDAENNILGVRIKQGDLTITGHYRIQVWDVTDPQASPRSAVQKFWVVDSLPEPTV